MQASRGKLTANTKHDVPSLFSSLLSFFFSLAPYNNILVLLHLLLMYELRASSYDGCYSPVAALEKSDGLPTFGLEGGAVDGLFFVGWNDDGALDDVSAGDSRRQRRLLAH